MGVKVKKRLKGIVESRTLHGILIVLLLWYVAYVAINSPIIPSPYRTILIFFELIGGDLLLHLLVSLLRILAAALISLAIGIPIGIAMGLNSGVDRILSPVTYILYPIPKIAFLPVLLILLGFGDAPKVVLIITIIVFQIQIAVRDAIKEIPRGLVYSVKTLGLTRPQRYRHLILPAILPKLFSSLRITLGISISVLFFSENFATEYGIGYFIMNSFTIIHYEEMFAGILGLSLMGLLLFKLIDLLEYRICPWIRLGES